MAKTFIGTPQIFETTNFEESLNRYTTNNHGESQYVSSKNGQVGTGKSLEELLGKLDAGVEGYGMKEGVQEGLMGYPSFLINNSLPTPPSSSPNNSSSTDLADSSSNLTDSIISVEEAVIGDDIEEEEDDTLVKLVDTPVNDLINQQISTATSKGLEQAFFVGDLSSVYCAVQQWKSSPLGDRVEIFYAVKCNPSPPVLHLLSLMGTSFDCASVSEIDMVLNLPTSPDPSRIIFANPCKPASFIRSAYRAGVEMMTFDNADELHKVARCHPNAKLVLRILTDDSKSLCRLGLKYGAPLSTCSGLIRLARKLGLNVIGVSFHVGSGCKDPMQFADAVWRAKQVFDMGKQEGYDFKFLDVGGGFEKSEFEEMSQVLRDALDLYFPEGEGVRIIAEPGRFLVSTAFTLATSIIARRRALNGSEDGILPQNVNVNMKKDESEGADVMYYINDGVYGAFNCIMFDHQIVHPYPLTISHSTSSAIPRLPGPPPPNVHLPVDLPVQMGYQFTEKASVWGPTCDSIDCVRNLVDLPVGLEVGDWLGWGEMGAYTMCAASRFNGMPISNVCWTTGGWGKESLAVRRIWDDYMGVMKAE